jgi:2-polyprenyl-6-methoxyphenol hydroxylase-like FAD-dependent oxidoreductase
MDSSEQQYDSTETMSCTQAYLQPRPHIEVIIVGGGLAGLLLGILLHKAGTPFTILERASSIKPLGISHSSNNFTVIKLMLILNKEHAHLSYLFSLIGAVMALGVNVFPILQQLDLFEDLQRISKPILTTNMYREDMKKLGAFEVKESTEM